MGARGPFQDKPAIRVEALSLARGGRLLFEGLSFSAGPGEYLELVGPNGSGKTSLLRALAGFLRPRVGRIAVDRAPEPALAMHYIAHANALKGAASVRAHLRYWAGLFNGDPREEAVFDKLGLGRLAEAPARTLSQGQARRLALARLLIAPRPIWLLDEPAAGLDAQGRAILSALIDNHRTVGGLALAAVHEPLGPAPNQTLALA